jgi:hypothetical protein
MGALLRESIEELAKASKIPRGKLAIHGRCIVDAAIQGAYDQWRAFGKRLAHAKELRSLHPEEVPQYLRPETEEELFDLGPRILDEFPEIDVEVSVADEDRRVIIPDVGSATPIEV